MTRDTGAVSVAAAVVATGLIMLTIVLSQAAGLILIRHQAAAAADLSALAASRAADGGADGCAAADLIAGHLKAEVIDCQLDYAVATVTVRTVSAVWWSHRWAAQQTARAAPTAYLDGS